MPDRLGDLAIVLHSHMPYVEGFGTYPFGEEWLFDAVARSYLPVLDVAHSLTMTVTPVLADQLEAGGVAERLREFVLTYRLGAAERDVDELDAELATAANTEADRYRRALERLDSAGGSVLDLFRHAAAHADVALIPSAATHAVLPLLATAAGRRLQIDAGLRSHHRRFGAASGFWLPECAYRRGIEAQLAERGIEYFCVDQSAYERGLEALTPARAQSGLVAFPIHWPTVELVWGKDGYPSAPAYQEYHRQSLNGTRLWSIGGAPYDADAARDTARSQAEHFLGSVVACLEDFVKQQNQPGLLVFAIDTELLGAWWSEGPLWLKEVLDAAPARGVRLLTLPAAVAEHPAEERPLLESSWGEGKDLRTWDSPRVADLVWAARRLELRVLRALANGIEPQRAERAARELLATQSSDWAFLDARGQAGDYAYGRAVGHSQALLEALDSPRPPDPRMRNLAPDISLATLLEP